MKENTKQASDKLSAISILFPLYSLDITKPQLHQHHTEQKKKKSINGKKFVWLASEQ